MNLRTSRFVILCVLSQSVFTALDGQAFVKQSYGTEQDYKRLFFLNVQYIQSWVRSDTATYNRLLWADDFVHQNSADGLLYPKPQIGALFGQPRFESIDYFYADQVQIKFISNDVALVLARPPYKAKNSNMESVSQYNDVYVRRDSAWICVSANVVSVLKPNTALPRYTTLPVPLKLKSYYVADTADQNALKKLHQAKLQATAINDTVALNTILVADLTVLLFDGTVLDKPKYLERVAKKPTTTLRSTADKSQTRWVARDLAMIHYTQPVGPKMALQCNDVYIKRDGSWKCININQTPIKN